MEYKQRKQLNTDDNGVTSLLLFWKSTLENIVFCAIKHHFASCSSELKQIMKKITFSYSMYEYFE